LWEQIFIGWDIKMTNRSNITLASDQQQDDIVMIADQHSTVMGHKQSIIQKRRDWDGAKFARVAGKDRKGRTPNTIQ